MATLFTNGDGLTQRYGQPEDALKPYVRTAPACGAYGQLVVRFNSTHLGSAESEAPAEWWDEDFGGGSTPDSPSGLNASIPNGAVVTGAKLIVTTAFTTGDSGALNLGLYHSNGDVDDVDGIDVAIAAGTLTLGAVIDCNGAQVAAGILGGAASGDRGLYLGGHASTGGFTAGAATLIVEYVMP